MRKRSPPPPSKSSERVKEYLEMVKIAQTEKGSASGYDFYKKAMNQAQKNRMIKYLLNNHLIREINPEEYVLTDDGEAYLNIFRTRSRLVGLLTKDLHGDRINPW